MGRERGNARGRKREGVKINLYRILLALPSGFLSRIESKKKKIETSRRYYRRGQVRSYVCKIISVSFPSFSFATGRGEDGVRESRFSGRISLYAYYRRSLRFWLAEKRESREGIILSSECSEIERGNQPRVRNVARSQKLRRRARARSRIFILNSRFARELCRNLCVAEII